jgi:hypothetical protein
MVALQHKSVRHISTSGRIVYFGFGRKMLRFFWIYKLRKEKSCCDEVIGLFEWPKTDYNQECITNQHRGKIQKLVFT